MRDKGRRADSIPVTLENFVRAETDMYFGHVVKGEGFGRFVHHRELVPVDNQTIVRTNRDTLYSSAVFDLDAAPVTITLPDTGTRFCSMMVVNQDHYVRLVTYEPGAHVLTRERTGTRYVLATVRTLVDPSNPADICQVHAVQNSIQVNQRAPGTFDVPQWDAVSQGRVRDALLLLGSTMPDFKNAFGSRDQVDPIRHLIATAVGWGGNPDKDAVYLHVTPRLNDGLTMYTLTVKDVPVDGFWSISVYNAKGYFEENPFHAYSLNNVTAKKSADGSIGIQFGGCDGKTHNCLPIMKGWNYLVRLYRPRAEILNGRWQFPEALPFEAEMLQAS